MSRADGASVSTVVLVAAWLLAGCATPRPTAIATASDAPIPSVAPASPEASATTPSGTRGAGDLDSAWERLEDAPFARLEMATSAHGGRIWLAGGLSPFGEALTEVDVLDPATGSWTEGPSLPAGVHHAALVSDGDRLLLIGGYLGSSFSQPTDIVLVLADGDDTWRPGPPLPDERAAGAAAWDGSRVVYAGGVGVGVVADVYALEGDSWSRLGALGRPREHLAAASDREGRTWFLGGRVGGLDTNLAAVEVVEGGAITPLDPLPTPRGGVAAFHLPGIGACATGGEAPDRAFTTVECVDASGQVQAIAELTTPHHGHGAAVVYGTAYVVLGGPEPTLSAGAVVERLLIDERG
jgi:Kelch motif